MDSIIEQREFFDLSFSDEPASYYYLILELDDTQIKVMWYHLSKNLVTGFASYPVEKGDFRNWLKSSTQLKADFKEVIISVRTDNYLINPRGIVDGSNPDVFRITNEFNDAESDLHSHPLVNLKADMVFSLSKEVDEILHSAFSHVTIVPHTAPMVERSFNLLQNRQSKTLIKAHINSQSVDILAFKKGKLLMVNSFYQTTKEDVAYYVLYAAEVLDFDASKHILEVSGELDLGDDTWNLLSEYWKRIELVAPLDNIKISQALQGYDPAKYDYLTHALLCVS